MKTILQNLQNEIKEREPKLKRDNAAMASSSAMTPFNSLSDEVVLKIVTLAAAWNEDDVMYELSPTDDCGNTHDNNYLGTKPELFIL